MPKSNEHQVIENISIDTDILMYMAKEDVYGNSFVVLDGDIESGEGIDISISLTRIEGRAYPDSLTQEMMDLLTSRTDQLPKNIRFEMVNRSIKETGAGFGKSLFDIVVDQMSFTTPVLEKDAGDAKEAFSRKTGNSKDYASVFESITRMRGYPTRLKGGFIFPEDSTGAVEHFHFWTEFYVENLGWIPVDPVLGDLGAGSRYDYYGRLDTRRIHLSTGRDVKLPHSAPHDIVSSIVYPYVKINGRVTYDYSMSFTYSEL